MNLLNNFKSENRKSEIENWDPSYPFRRRALFWRRSNLKVRETNHHYNQSTYLYVNKFCQTMVIKNVLHSWTYWGYFVISEKSLEIWLRWVLLIVGLYPTNMRSERSEQVKVDQWPTNY